MVKKNMILLSVFIITLECIGFACHPVVGVNNDTVTAPEFSPPSGVYTTNQNITITCSAPDVTIYYTIDGTIPTTKSAVYTSPVAVAGDCLDLCLMAIAINKAKQQSAIKKSTYIIEHQSNWSFAWNANEIIPDTDFYNPRNWVLNQADSKQGDTGSVSTDDVNLQLNWTLGSGNRSKWVQCYSVLSEPISLTTADIFAFDFKGSNISGNVGFKLKFESGPVQAAKRWDRLAKLQRWGDKIVILKKELVNADLIDWSSINVISCEVYADPSEDNITPESGTINIKNFIFSTIAQWEKASALEFICREKYAQIKTGAINAIMNRQTNTGLLCTWIEDDTAYLYGQGLALKALCIDGVWDGVTPINASARAAESLALFLANHQMDAGYWPRAWRASTGEIIREVEDNNTIWMGDFPWPLVGLQCYAKKSHDERVSIAINKALQFIKSLIDENGRLFTLNIQTNQQEEVSSCEAYAAVLTGLYESNETIIADLMWNYILTNGWHNDLGFWKESKDSKRPVLFANTWLSPFLVRSGNLQMAVDALSIIGKILYTRGPGAPQGLDGIGPLAVWFEGSLSYICSGGPGSKILFEDLKDYINADGSVCHYNDNIESVGGIWAVNWHSLDGTSWLYFAASGKSPFDIFTENQ